MCNILKFMFVICLLLIATPAFAVDDFYGPQNGGGTTHSRSRASLGSSTWEESYTQKLDVQGFMERLYTVLTSPEHLGGHAEVAHVAEYMKTLGLFNLAGMESEYKISGEDMSMWCSKRFDGLSPDSFYGKLLALPNRKLTSAKFVGEDDHLLYLAINNVPQILMIELEELGKAQSAAGGEEALSGILEQADMGDLGEVLGMLKALKLDETVMNALSGEMAVVVYGIPAFDKLQGGNIQPGDLDLCLMLGLNDSEFIDGLIAQFGVHAGLQKIEVPSGWTGYNMNGEESIGCIYNDELLIVSPNIKATLEHVAAAKGHALRVPQCQEYVSLNMAELDAKVVTPLVAMLSDELGDVKVPSSSMAYLTGLPESAKLGQVTMMASFDGDGGSSEVHAKKALVPYFAYYLGVGLCVAGQMAVEKKVEAAQAMAEQSAVEAPPAGDCACEGGDCGCGGDCPLKAEGKCPKDTGEGGCCPDGAKK